MIMRLGTFFERFDSARDNLRRVARSGCIGECLDELDKNGMRQTAHDILGGVVRYRDFKYSLKDPFARRKNSVRVCRSLGLCYVPSDLAKDVVIAERIYKEYLANTPDALFGQAVSGINDGMEGKSK